MALNNWASVMHLKNCIVNSLVRLYNGAPTPLTLLFALTTQRDGEGKET